MEILSSNCIELCREYCTCRKYVAFICNMCDICIIYCNIQE